MSTSTIIVYGTDWCSDCRRAIRLLNEQKIPFQWINIDQDKQGEQFVLKANKGMRSVPTIVFQDGSILVEPSNKQLSQKIREYCSDQN